MTDAQRDELERLRRKAANPEMVTVPRALLAKVLADAYSNCTSASWSGIARNPGAVNELRRWEDGIKAEIIELRAIAGIE